MAIAGTDPQNVEDTNAVIVDSDAGGNTQAMHEIEGWAAEHGFARTTEYHLRRVRRKDGKVVFRGFCYRITPEEIASAESDVHALERAVTSQRTSVDAANTQ